MFKENREKLNNHNTSCFRNKSKFSIEMDNGYTKRYTFCLGKGNGKNFRCLFIFEIFFSNNQRWIIKEKNRKIKADHLWSLVAHS